MKDAFNRVNTGRLILSWVHFFEIMKSKKLFFDKNMLNRVKFCAEKEFTIRFWIRFLFLIVFREGELGIDSFLFGIRRRIGKNIGNL